MEIWPFSTACSPAMALRIRTGLRELLLVTRRDVLKGLDRAQAQRLVDSTRHAAPDVDEVERAALVEGLVDGTLVLEVSVTRDGEDAPDELVHVLDAAGHQLDARYTDRDGLAIFELPVGDVLVSASDVSVTARVSTVEVSRVDVELED